ncbi:Y+L amino acid transporter 2-like [Aplysia californica]|uniref:Y+L amino acid transporter 2-like n=1 Tax=Aplysia californica TaxID=6500 RepID=A0ABM1AFT5_APLCA|nr:Y+L amino acid transporter 2-like [Aplysia californica]
MSKHVKEKAQNDEPESLEVEMEGVKMKRELGMVGTTSMVIGLIIGALCYAELGTMMPKSGGAYTYLRKGMGNAVAFSYMFQYVVIQMPCSQVIVLLTCSKYLLTLLPMCGSPQSLEKLVTAAIMVTLFLLNSYSSRVSTRTAIITTISKVISLSIIIIAGFLVIGQGSVKELGTGFEGTSTNPSSLALAMYSAVWAYGGSELVNNVVEEIKDPSR